MNAYLEERLIPYFDTGVVRRKVSGTAVTPTERAPHPPVARAPPAGAPRCWDWVGRRRHLGPTASFGAANSIGYTLL